MWFGTRVHMQDIVDPDINPDYESVPWGETSDYLNGGLGVSSSAVAHREYVLSWSNLTRAQARQITDYADGVYGDGLVYWIDPVAADANVLPQSWAVPALGALDGVPLAGAVRPTTTANANFSQGYPANNAVYTITEDTTPRSIFVPIPTGHVAWVGVHGDVSAQDFVKVTPYTGAVAGTVVFPSILSVSTSTRVNTEIGDGATGLELSLDNTTPGTPSLSGMIVQILPDGETPATGGFVSGQGHSGCAFIGRPVVVPNTVADGLELVDISVKLGEVGEWV